MDEKISIYNRNKPLSELRDVLGWNTTTENTTALVMVLCQRVAALQARVEELEASAAKLQQEQGEWLTENLPPTTAPYNPRPGAEYGVQV